MHEAKVDVVTVPNLSEHLSSADTTAQLSARFAYAAAMKSINNLLLLGDGETWARQRVDFAGLPEMVRTFLQVAAGAADIPVTRLLGQSPAGLSATGDSDTRNYYDMIAARQELDLRPQLERLDRLILASEGLAPDALTFAFRPLWQMDAAIAATVALTKAQATQIYAGLGLWPVATMARLVEAQVIADGTYPGAEAVFAEADVAPVEDASPALDFDPAQPRDPDGRWARGAGVPPDARLTLVSDPEKAKRRLEEGLGRWAWSSGRSDRPSRRGSDHRSADARSVPWTYGRRAARSFPTGQAVGAKRFQTCTRRPQTSICNPRPSRCRPWSVCPRVHPCRSIAKARHEAAARDQPPLRCLWLSHVRHQGRRNQTGQCSRRPPAADRAQLEQ